MDVSVEKLYFADTGNRRIRSVDLSSGIIDTVAGGGMVEVGDGLDAKMISFSSHPMRVALDNVGNFLVSDAHHNRIRKIDKNSGVITTVAGDVAEFFSTGANTVQCVNYTKADGTAVVSSAGGAWTLISSSEGIQMRYVYTTFIYSSFEIINNLF